MPIKYRKKWLDIPTLSQLNENNRESWVWCGRTSGCMIYNYYMKARGEPDSKLIVNSQDSSPYNLIYPHGSIACSGPGSYYYLSEPPERAVAGWEHKHLYPREGRQLPVSREQIQDAELVRGQAAIIGIPLNGRSQPLDLYPQGVQERPQPWRDVGVRQVAVGLAAAQGQIVVRPLFGDHLFQRRVRHMRVPGLQKK